jgi:hypothetical protein
MNPIFHRSDEGVGCAQAGGAVCSAPCLANFGVAEMVLVQFVAV